MRYVVGHTSANTVEELRRYVVDELRRIQNNYNAALDDLSGTIPSLQFSAYAGVSLNATHTDDPMGVGWNPLDFYDTHAVDAREITLGLNGVFSFQRQGVYAMAVTGSVAHNTLNAGRAFNVRLFNITEGTGSSGILIGSGRDVAATTVPIVTMVTIAEEDIGDSFRVEYGGGDVYTDVVWNALAFSVWNVSEWRR